VMGEEHDSEEMDSNVSQVTPIETTTEEITITAAASTSSPDDESVDKW
jgi:hypothetical protein